VFLLTIVLLLPSGVPSSASGDRGIGLPKTERASPVAFCDESERIAPFGASSLADRIPSKMPRVQTTTNGGRTSLASLGDTYFLLLIISEDPKNFSMPMTGFHLPIGSNHESTLRVGSSRSPCPRPLSEAIGQA
jgi:hypothetical protein